MKKLLGIVVLGLLLSGNAYAKNLFEYISSDHPPKLIVGYDGFNEALNKEINDLNIYLGIREGKKPIYNSFNQLLINSDADGEIEFNDENYFIVSGCRPHSCPEKGFLWIDKKEKIVLAAMIHYFIDDKKDIDNGYLLIISKKFKSYNDLPRKFNEDLNAWLSTRSTWDYVKNDIKKLIPSVKRFVNSENKIKKIK